MYISSMTVVCVWVCVYGCVCVCVYCFVFFFFFVRPGNVNRDTRSHSCEDYAVRDVRVRSRSVETTIDEVAGSSSLTR